MKERVAERPVENRFSPDQLLERDLANRKRTNRGAVAYDGTYEGEFMLLSIELLCVLILLL